MSNEILSTTTAVHRELFNSGKGNNSVRMQRWRWKTKKLGPQMMEKLLLERGYIKVEDAKWIKNE